MIFNFFICNYTEGHFHTFHNSYIYEHYRLEDNLVMTECNFPRENIFYHEVTITNF